MTQLAELENEITVEFASGSVVRYRYKGEADADPLIERTLTTPDGAVDTAAITINEIRSDSENMAAVAAAVSYLEGI